MTDEQFRIIVTPRGSDGFSTTDNEHDARILTNVIRSAVWVQYGTDVKVQQIRHHEPPSRFHATPADIDAFLRFHFAEDTLLRYQQAIGGRAVAEAAEDIQGESGSPLAGQQFQEGMRFAADLVDPLKGGGHWPSSLIEFPTKERISSHE